MRKWITLACVFFVFSATAANQPPAETLSVTSTDPGAGKLIDDVLAVSGIKDVLENLPGQISQGIRMSALSDPGRVPESVMSEMQDAAMEAYSSEALIDGVAKAIKENWHEKRLREVLETVSTPLSRRMTALESKEPSPTELGSFVAKLATQPLPSARLALLKQLDDISRSSEFAIKVLSSTVHSVALGATNGCGEGLAAFNKKFEEQRGQFEEDTRNSIRAQMAFTYRSVSDADLRKYIKSMNKESSRWFNNIVYDAIDKGFTAGGEQLGRSLQEVLKKKFGGPKAGGCQEV